MHYCVPDSSGSWPRQNLHPGPSWPVNMHYFCEYALYSFFMRSLNPDSHYWSLSLRTETEKNSAPIKTLRTEYLSRDSQRVVSTDSFSVHTRTNLMVSFQLLYYVLPGFCIVIHSIVTKLTDVSNDPFNVTWQVGKVDWNDDNYMDSQTLSPENIHLDQLPQLLMIYQTF